MDSTIKEPALYFRFMFHHRSWNHNHNQYYS